MEEISFQTEYHGCQSSLIAIRKNVHHLNKLSGSKSAKKW